MTNRHEPSSSDDSSTPATRARHETPTRHHRHAHPAARAPYDTNAGREIDAVAALIAHARSRLPDLVADARDQANTWAEIADQLDLSRPRVIARYGLRVQRRRPPIELD
jgi:predicted aminopeptidase